MRPGNSEAVVVYGFPASLYTAKVRSYLIKKGIPFLERHPGHPRFGEHIVPVCGSRRLPIVEHADGSVTQDSNDIIERLDREHPRLPALPPTPVQRLVARLVNLFADEALLKQAMHYRWNTTPENRAFVERDFGFAFAREASETAIRRSGADAARLFSGYVPLLGISAETAEAIEAVHLECLDYLERHFAAHPYLLGGHPSLADYALMGPLYAHLARDPHAGSLLHRRAPRVLRWTEEMNRPSPFLPDHPERELAFEAGDRIPDTLKPVLGLMFETFGPELAAFAGRFREFIEKQPDRPAGAPLESSGYDQPSLGKVEIDYRGTRMRMVARMFPLWLFQAVKAEYVSLKGATRRSADALLVETGGAAMMSITLPRALTRQNNKLVLGGDPVEPAASSS